MIEVVSEAIVLGAEEKGEYDKRVFFYTKDFGKITARATSLRKITSKLVSHCEPLQLVEIRIASRGDTMDTHSFQLTDALAHSEQFRGERTSAQIKNALHVVECIQKSIPEGVPDEELWNFLLNVSLGTMHATVADALRILGFDSAFSQCQLCNQAQPEYFFPKDHFFICQTCTRVSAVTKKDFILIQNLSQ